MSESSFSMSKATIIAAIIGAIATIGSAMITKGYFDKKIEDDYIAKTVVWESYKPSSEINVLYRTIDSLEKKVISLKAENASLVDQSTTKNQDGIFPKDNNVVEYEGIEIRVLKCSQTNKGIEFEILLTNVNENRKEGQFFLHAKQCRINIAGNEYLGYAATIGTRKSKNTGYIAYPVIYGVPVKAKLLVESPPELVKKIDLLDIYCGKIDNRPKLFNLEVTQSSL